MDRDNFLNDLIEHSELYKNFTEKDLKNYSSKDLIKLFIDDEQVKKTIKTLSKYFD